MRNIKKSLKIGFILALACISVLLMTLSASADIVSPDLPNGGGTLTYLISYDCVTYTIKCYRVSTSFYVAVDYPLECFNDIATAGLVEPITSDAIKFYLDTKYDIDIAEQFTIHLLDMYNSYKIDYEKIFRVARSVGYDEGLTDGYGEGYTDGTQNGLKEGEALQNGIKTIFSAPIYILTEVLDFEILGFSIYKFILSIITIFLFGYIVKTVIGFF